MTIHRSATLLLLLGTLTVGGCGGRPSVPQVGRMPERTSSNVVTHEQIDELTSVMTVEDVLVQLVAGIERANGSIRIRGMQGPPLIVVNGAPIGFGPIPVTAGDVGRVQVLRTGGEIAAYGFRGSNGVILVETRKE